jgi:hypothetical protein
MIDTEAAKLEDHHMDDLVQATRLLVDERRKNMMYLRFDIVLELNKKLVIMQCIKGMISNSEGINTCL